MSLELGVTNGGPRPALPAADSERWKPVRGGLLNLYRYDYEEFRYEQGHLLLRGDNGTGKSRVLALQLPFLLDGETASHRLEPDGDAAKRIEWNLLMGRHADRLGYTWLELGRRDAGGTCHYLTLGAGLRAVEGRGLVGRWFFTTSLRIGESLFLQSAAGPALTRERLAEALGDRGEIFTSAAAYRRAIDEALFKLGEHRYGALVDLLVKLRQPQLSRQLDERRLSAALSEALPPVTPAIVADVADSFRSLEADRAALEAFQAAGRGVEHFLDSYRRYTRLAARRRSDDVRRAHAAYETTMRTLRAAESARETATVELAAAAARIKTLALEETRARATVDTLRASPQMRDAETLQLARDAATRLKDDETRVEAALARTRRTLEQREHERDVATAATVASRTELQTVAAQAGVRAAGPGLEVSHRSAFGPLGLPDGIEEQAAIERARRSIEQSVSERVRAVEHVRPLVTAVESATTELSSAKRAHTEATAQLDEAMGTERHAHDTLAERQTELVRGYRAWAGALAECEPEDPAAIEEALGEWCRTVEGPSPVATAVRGAGEAAIKRLAGLRAEIDQRRKEATAGLDVLRAEQARLAGGQHLPPPPPHTRDATGRAGRAGAPLWLLCDFRPALDDASRAGLEAALEASGLLDAWVTPDGALLPAGAHDTAVVPGTSPQPDADSHLGLWLVPAVDRTDAGVAALSDDVVAAVLRHVGTRAGAGSVFVGTDGRWQVGPLHGAWDKTAAAHIGQGARQAARRRRLEELAAEITAAEAGLARLDVELAAVTRREEAARREVAAAPGDDRVRAAHAAGVAAARAVAAQRARLIDAERLVADKRRVLETAVKTRDDAALDLGITAWVADLRALEQAIGGYREALAALWPTIRSHAAASSQAAQAAQHVQEAATAQAEQESVLADTRRRLAQAEAERDTLEQSVGAAAEEILRRLADARGELARIEADVGTAREARETAAIARGVSQEKVETQNQVLEDDAGRRESAVTALRTFAAARLLDIAQAGIDAGDPAGWSVTRAVEVARALDAALAGVDGEDTAWERVQKEVHAGIQRLIEALLPYGYQPESTVEDGLFVVTVPFQGRDCTMSELRAALGEEVANRQLLLDAREREILENHLIGEVSAHLHERLRGAETLVREMNDELRTRRTSTGMILRFAWEPLEDGPPGLLEARTRLLRAGGTWSSAERQELGAFLQARINAVRTADDAGTWQEHLSLAFDYRTWHHFCVERQQDGVWKRLTRRTHGTGSGGEKAIALTIPQFAAAAAHYRTADPLAPRLILLDEAFVGIDKGMRAQCMGLLAAFDLDFVMTSEQEWGCYATLPGVAIYQLSTRPGIDAVGITRWIWNGRERALDTARLPSAAPPPDLTPDLAS
ncbi:MAG TPA: TIGR02680 family protein [Candidatus Limnocylindria bacterium]|nr:TIGR02680 family protein [Candidatus Limnocylindria bacterium]